MRKSSAIKQIIFNRLFLTDFYKLTVYLEFLYHFDDSQMFYVTGGQPGWSY